MSRQFYIGLAALVICVSLISIWLIPTSNEIALMKLKDNHYHDARQRYEMLAANGDHSINVIIPLAQLYLNAGDIDKALATVEAFVAKNPRNLEARNFLGDLYSQADRPEDYIANLEYIIQKEPTAQRLKELANACEIRKDFTKQAKALAELIKMPDYKPDETEIYKLSYALAAEHKYDQSLALMEQYLHYNDFSANEDFVLQAVSVALEKDEGKAFALANEYLHHSPDSSKLIRLSESFRDYGKNMLAYKLLEPFTAQMDTNNPLLAEYVTVLLQLGKKQETYAYLAKRFQNGTLPKEVEEPFIELAMENKNYGLLEQALPQFHIADLPESLLLRMAALSLSDKRYLPLAQQLNTAMSKMKMPPSALLKNVLEVAASDDKAAVERLLHYPPYVLSSDEKQLLIKIAMSKRAFTYAYQLLKDEPLEHLIADLEPYNLAELYATSGKINELENNLQHITPASPVIAVKIEETRLYAALAKGDEAAFRRSLPSIRQNMMVLENSYNLASVFNHPRLAVMASEALYQLHPSDSRAIELSDALLNANMPEQVDKYLTGKRLLIPAAESNYLDAMAMLRKEHRSLNSKQQAELNQIVGRIANRPATTVQQKRELAYMILEAGMAKDAQSIFLGFLRSGQHNTDDIEQLIAMQKRYPSPMLTDWLIAKAKQAEPAAKGKWLALLNNMGNHRQVAQLASRDTSPVTLATLDAYSEALLTLKQKEPLETLLARTISENSDNSVLKKAVKIANGENFATVTDAGLRKLALNLPEDKAVQRDFALSLFDKGAYSEAEPLLAALVRDKDADIKVNYAYAELLWRHKLYAAAKSYYTRAEEAIAGQDRQTFESRVMKAHLLSRLKRANEATAVWDALLEEEPGNKRLRAEYANFLIEQKQFKQAETLLSAQ